MQLLHNTQNSVLESFTHLWTLVTKKNLKDSEIPQDFPTIMLTILPTNQPAPDLRCKHEE